MPTNKITLQARGQSIKKAVLFERPDFIPMIFAINPSCWESYDQQALTELMVEHPMLFPDYEPPPLPVLPVFKENARKNQPYTDDWGCVWKTAMNGITGTVVGHPLADWGSLEDFTAPAPECRTGRGPRDWDNVREQVAAAKTQGMLTSGSLLHGHTFLQLCDLRGYENLMYDMEDEEPCLLQLIELVEQFNLDVVNRFLDCGVEMMCYPEDLGMQVGPMLSPTSFRRYIKPSYQRIIKPARDRGVLIHMHSDGDIRLLADDIIDGGVDVINLQDLVNGIDWIAGRFKGKTCVDLDIDRQSVTRFGTPAQIDELIRHEVESLALKEGGLTMIYGLYPDIPLENIKAIMDAMERYSLYFS